jgi:hypothetical protein
VIEGSLGLSREEGLPDETSDQEQEKERHFRWFPMARRGGPPAEHGAGTRGSVSRIRSIVADREPSGGEPHREGGGSNNAAGVPERVDSARHATVSRMR